MYGKDGDFDIEFTDDLMMNAVMMSLLQLGCSVERMEMKRVLAVSVPSGLLDSLVSQGINPPRLRHYRAALTPRGTTAFTPASHEASRCP